VTIFVVDPVAVVLTNPQKTTSQFQFAYSANINLRYVIEKSTDLIQWQAIGTNKAATAQVTFTDSNPGPTQNFYRVGRLPNPEP
jgi:hypothetical protein